MGEQQLLTLETQGEMTSEEKWWALEELKQQGNGHPLQFPGECKQIPFGNSDLQPVS